MKYHVFDAVGDYVCSFSNREDMSDFFDIQVNDIANAMFQNTCFLGNYFVSKNIDFCLKKHNKQLFSEKK